MSTKTDQILDRLDQIDTEGAIHRVLNLADELETEWARDLAPWMVARLLRVAVTDDLRSALSDDAERLVTN